jgi:predicted transcriptional regulator
MKAVLISIKPKWCELIANGKKTIEVRKTKPKIETPFKCYIYETQGRAETPWIDEDGHEIFKGRGQVIGEFVCDKIVQFENSLFDEALSETVARSCVPMYDLLVYLGKQDYGYGWHISDLAIYDNPRDLKQYFYACDKPKGTDCSLCLDRREQKCKAVTRPPQSWCYVERREVC